MIPGKPGLQLSPRCDQIAPDTLQFLQRRRIPPPITALLQTVVGLIVAWESGLSWLWHTWVQAQQLPFNSIQDLQLIYWPHANAYHAYHVSSTGREESPSSSSVVVPIVSWLS
ncbi:hypothetical protein SDJN02_13440, partial [Cucurbita argyrosperma subsp. argyrosperma]